MSRSRFPAPNAKLTPDRCCRPTKDVKADDKEETKVEAVKEDKPSGDAQPI